MFLRPWVNVLEGGAHALQLDQINTFALEKNT